MLRPGRPGQQGRLPLRHRGVGPGRPCHDGDHGRRYGLRSRLFTKAEIENGRSAWLLGLSFISEGAIPFAAADPLRVIPATMAGGAVTGAMTMAMHVGSRAPHGGVFVAFAITHFGGFLLAILAGTVVSTALVIVLKGLGRNADGKKGAEAQAAAAA